jgi:hypothetical protein
MAVSYLSRKRLVQQVRRVFLRAWLKSTRKRHFDRDP